MQVPRSRSNFFKTALFQDCMCLWTHKCKQYSHHVAAKKPKTQEHRNTAICFFPLLSPPHKYTLIATVFRVSLGLAKWEPVFPRELCQSYTWSLSLEEWNPPLSYCYFLAERRTAPLCSRAPGFQGVRLLLDSWPPGSKGGSSESNPSIHGPARHPKSCSRWGSKGREGAAFQKSSKMQICLHLGTGQDHFCFLQPRLEACTFQVMKSGTHFEWKIQFMWTNLFCKWHVKRAFKTWYFPNIFTKKKK